LREGEREIVREDEREKERSERDTESDRKREERLVREKKFELTSVIFVIRFISGGANISTN